MKHLLYIAGIFILFASCEKVIEVPLNETAIQTIVEAKLYDEPYQSFVKLSESGSMYNNSDFPKISGATVTVTDDQNNSWTFLEDPQEPGKYIDTSFITQPNTTYSLTVVNGTETYTATSYTQSDVQFDSLDYQIAVGGFGQAEADTNYFTFFNFTDNGNEENYYRIIPIKNGDRSSAWYLSDDVLYNGYNFRQPFFTESFENGDTLIAVLVSLDKAMYTYYSSLANGQGGGPFSPTPSNPVTNIEGEAIGYFGAFMTGNEMLVYP